ncbi:MAG: hypothetical protein ACLPX8_01870 [Bryobacteraceae bacterium]
MSRQPPGSQLPQLQNPQDNCPGLGTFTVVAGKEIIGTGGIAVLILLGCNKLAEGITVEFSLPLVDCPCGNIPLAAVACGEAAFGREAGADSGTFELLPAEEEDFSNPVAQASAGAYLDPREAPRPLWVSGTAVVTAPALRLPAALRTVSEVGGPIAITICLAVLALSAAGNSAAWPEKRRRGRRQKKSRATPGRRRAA